jgi:hypothetical protein
MSTSEQTVTLADLADLVGVQTDPRDQPEASMSAPADSSASAAASLLTFKVRNSLSNEMMYFMENSGPISIKQCLRRRTASLQLNF